MGAAIVLGNEDLVEDMKCSSTRGYLLEFKVDMDSRTLAIRKNGTWEDVPQAAGRFPDAASPWVSLGSDLLEVTLSMQVVSESTVNKLHAELVQDLRALFDSGV